MWQGKNFRVTNVGRRRPAKACWKFTRSLYTANFSPAMSAARSVKVSEVWKSTPHLVMVACCKSIESGDARVMLLWCLFRNFKFRLFNAKYHSTIINILLRKNISFHSTKTRIDKMAAQVRIKGFCQKVEECIDASLSIQPHFAKRHICQKYWAAKQDYCIFYASSKLILKHSR